MQSTGIRSEPSRYSQLSSWASLPFRDWPRVAANSAQTGHWPFGRCVGRRADLPFTGFNRPVVTQSRPTPCRSGPNSGAHGCAISWLQPVKGRRLLDVLFDPACHFVRQAARSRRASARPQTRPNAGRKPERRFRVASKHSRCRTRAAHSRPSGTGIRGISVNSAGRECPLDPTATIAHARRIGEKVQAVDPAHR
jgi:hypothetical protein